MHRGLRGRECLPGGQGLTALLAVNLLERLDLGALPSLRTRRLHLIVEALRLVFADTSWQVADPELSEIPLAELMAKECVHERGGLISLDRGTGIADRGAPLSPSDTVFLTVVDRWGNACSFIHGLYMSFGPGVAPKGGGFCQQNRSLNLRLDPPHPSALARCKRSHHTIIPAIATREDGLLYASFGVTGDFMQPQGHAQVMFGMGDEELDRPCICLLDEDDLTAAEVAVGEGISIQTMGELVPRGLRIRPVHGFDRSVFGCGQVIVGDPESGVLITGSDPRADGCAMPLI